MSGTVRLNKIYKKSPKLIVRTIVGRCIIIPLNKGKGNLEGSFFSLNRTASTIWEKINGKDSLKTIAHLLTERFDAKPCIIEKDIIGVVKELKKRGMVIEV
jgi:hypothetical protein